MHVIYKYDIYIYISLHSRVCMHIVYDMIYKYDIYIYIYNVYI